MSYDSEPKIVKQVTYKGRKLLIIHHTRGGMCPECFADLQPHETKCPSCAVAVPALEIYFVAVDGTELNGSYDSIEKAVQAGERFVDSGTTVVDEDDITTIEQLHDSSAQTPTEVLPGKRKKRKGPDPTVMRETIAKQAGWDGAAFRLCIELGIEPPEDDTRKPGR